MNSSMKKRIEKLETKAELMKTESIDRQAKLQEIQRLEGQDSIKALLLKLELQYGRPVSFADVSLMAMREETTDG